MHDMDPCAMKTVPWNARKKGTSYLLPFCQEGGEPSKWRLPCEGHLRDGKKRQSFFSPSSMLCWQRRTATVMTCRTRWRCRSAAETWLLKPLSAIVRRHEASRMIHRTHEA